MPGRFSQFLNHFRTTAVLQAGLADAAASSAATFLVGVFAAATLSARNLGGYGVFYQAVFFGTVLPVQLVLIPAEIASLDLDRRVRGCILKKTVRLASGLSMIAGIGAVALGWSITSAQLAPRSAVAFAATGAVTGALWPLQDHVRRVLHLANSSWKAAAVSTTQLAMVSLSLVAVHAAGSKSVWLPFGILGIANAVSLSAGLVLANLRGAREHCLDLRARSLATSGKWLLGAAALPSFAGLAVAALVVRIAGLGVQGHVEAARVLGQPLAVVSLGLTSVLGPRVMEAARRNQRGRADRFVRLYGYSIAAVAILYGGFAATPWRANFLARLVPNAYAVSGLVALTILANLATNLTNPLRSQLIALHREAKLTLVEALGNLARLSATMSVGYLGAYSVPLGLASLAATRGVRYFRLLADAYRSHTGPPRDLQKEP